MIENLFPRWGTHSPAISTKIFIDFDMASGLRLLGDFQLMFAYNYVPLVGCVVGPQERVAKL